MHNFELELPDLLYFVKESCHGSLRDLLPSVRKLSDDVYRAHSHREDFPKDLPRFIKKFVKTLQFHLALEENNLFPHLEYGLSQRGQDTIVHLEDDHNQMKSDLIKLRKLTANYQAPEFFDHIGINFYEMLKEVDRIVLNHIQIEDHILFPMLKKYSSDYKGSPIGL